MADHSAMKLGKKEAKKDPRTLRLAKYFAASLPNQPASLDWSKDIQDWGMLGNDNLGDCTIAGVMHAEQSVSVNVDSMLSFSTQDAINYYEKWAGYNPADPSTDQGAFEVDILNQWRKQKVKGHALLAYADPDPGNMDHVEKSIALLGGCYIGVQLPLAAQSQTVWDLVGPINFPQNVPGSWGGHAVWVNAYDHANQLLKCITWGGVKLMTYRWWNAYCDEAHALVMGYWFRLGAAPSSKVFGDAGIDELFRLNDMLKDAEALSA